MKKVYWDGTEQVERDLTQAEIDQKAIDEAAHILSLIPTWETVRTLQKKMIAETDSMWRVARYQMQIFRGMGGPSDTEAQYNLMSDYADDIRANDEGLHATPDLAITALNNLTDPS